jgi:hypothetical protein
MKHYIFIFLLILNYISFAQVQNNISVSALEYKPEIPEAKTYEIVRNDSGKEIDSSILLQINIHRRKDDYFLWTVREGLEIRIFPIFPPK